MASQGPIVAFRYWKGVRDIVGKPHLRSWWCDFDWPLRPGDPLKAIHRSDAGHLHASHDEPAPKDGCQCGIHLWATVAEAVNGGQYEARTWSGSRHDADRLGAARLTAAIPVLGAAMAWGAICLHGQEGMRVEYALPVLIARPTQDDGATAAGEELLAELASMVGVPLCTRKELEILASEFGTLITRLRRKGTS